MKYFKIDVKDNGFYFHRACDGAENPDMALKELQSLEKCKLSMDSWMVLEGIRLRNIIKSNKEVYLTKKFKRFFDNNLYSKINLSQNNWSQNELIITFHDGKTSYMNMKFSLTYDCSDFTTKFELINIKDVIGLNFYDARPYSYEKLNSLPIRKKLKEILDDKNKFFSHFAKIYCNMLKKDGDNLAEFYTVFNDFIIRYGFHEIILSYLKNINKK